MSGTSPTAAFVDATGIHAPTYPEIVTYLSAQFKLIYGADIVITPDSQDGQLIGIFALAISDANAACIAAYNAYGPQTAQGVGLSNMVKINGLARALPSNSSVPLYITGNTGTVIINGVATDGVNRWLLPASVIIPPSGDIWVTGIAEQPGAVTALPETVTRIATVTLGWQTVTNGKYAATPGIPVENDPELRARQAQSTANPSRTVLEGITGAVMAVPGVTEVVAYENDTNVDYTPTVPPAPPAPLPPLGVGPIQPHSIALVVRGAGDSMLICQTILNHKTPGCYTVGTTRQQVNDIYKLPHDIGYYIPVAIPLMMKITLVPGAGYTTLVRDAIRVALAGVTPFDPAFPGYINSLGSGADVIYSKLWLPANLCGLEGTPSDAGSTYDIKTMTISKRQSPVFGTLNIPIAINEVATIDPADVDIVEVT